MLISTTMENIGVMMFQGIVPAAVVSNLIGSSTFILWGKLEHWIEDLRAELDSPYAFEWFQWLAIKLQELQDDPSLPAYEAHVDWVPLNMTNDLGAGASKCDLLRYPGPPLGLVCPLC